MRKYIIIHECLSFFVERVVESSQILCIISSLQFTVGHRSLQLLAISHGLSLIASSFCLRASHSTFIVCRYCSKTLNLIKIFLSLFLPRHKRRLKQKFRRRWAYHLSSVFCQALTLVKCGCLREMSEMCLLSLRE
jgi:hypothetical protein